MKRSFGLISTSLVLAIAFPASAAPPRELPDPSELDESGETGIDEQSLDERRELEFQDHLGRGRRAAQQRRWTEAIDEYTFALEIHDGDPEALRGRAHARRGETRRGRCPREAIEDLTLLEVYDPRGLWLAERGTAVTWMGDCESFYAKEALQIAEELASLERGEVGRPNDIRVTAAELRVAEAAMARVDQRLPHHEAALEHLAAYRTEAAADGSKPLLTALRLEADLHLVLDDPAQAVAALDRILALHPDDAEAVREAERQIDDLEVQITVAELEKVQGGLPTPEAEAAYNRGLSALRRQDLATAAAEFGLAVQDSPWYPKAHFYLGEVHARSGKDEFPLAIESYKRAIAMERYDYTAYMALGLLYKKEFSGAEDDQARTNLDMALRLRPDLYDLHYHLGELWARSDKQKAIEHFQRYLELADSDDPNRSKASEAIEKLESAAEKSDDRFVPPLLPSELRRLDPELHRLINEAYVYGAEHGEWDRAERLLLQAQDKFATEPVLFNMLATVVEAQGRPGQARMYWEQSLELDPKQAEIHERLGLMLAESDIGLEHLERAADLGSLIARYRYAKLLWERVDLWTASDELDIYLREAGPYDVHWDKANELRAHMDAVFLKIYLGTGLLAFVLLAIPAILIWRRFRGSSLRQLLDRSPTCFPEVARILSLIRHEILKHNTSFLSDVGRALEVDEPDAEARATLLARRLFGDDSSSLEPNSGQRGERRGIYGRFLGYVAELHKVARGHGVTLNLRRKDPTFKAMLRAFEDVAAYTRELRHPGGLRGGRKLELARVLSRAGDVLGRKAFDQLSGVIRSLCVAKVDHEFIARVYEEIATEPKFSNVQIAPLHIDGDSQRVRIFPTDLHDILANVFRNSLMSSVMYAQPPIGLGVALASEFDDITGLTSLVIRVKDRSPERLTNEMLRGRYVERGMGITADLLSRYDGSIAVEPESGWEKAVVLRFFALEDGEVAVEPAPAREFGVPAAAGA